MTPGTTGASESSIEGVSHRLNQLAELSDGFEERDASAATRRPCGSKSGGRCQNCRAKDEELAARARTMLEQHPHFIGRTDVIEFESKRGTLRVSGCLPTYYLKQMLQHALINLEGLEQLQNDVQVYPALGCEEEPGPLAH